MQPLDVTVYGPVKSFYKSQCNAWSNSNAGRNLEVRHIVGLVATSLDLDATPLNIKAGFRSTGIWPVNPNIFTDSDFICAEISGENTTAVSVEDNVNAGKMRLIYLNENEPAAFETCDLNNSDSRTSQSSELSRVLAEVSPISFQPPRKKVIVAESSSQNHQF